jgi:hypothetical protein
MNARLSASSHSARRTFAGVLATLGLLLGLVASLTGASAQVIPLNIQFFDVIGGGTSLYSVSSGALLHSPEGEFVGRSGLTQFGDELGSSFSNLAFSTTSVETAGSLTVISFTLTGVNTGSYHGLAANCAGIAVPGKATLRVDEQTLVSESWASTPREERSDVPELEQASMVVEQWISYDEAQIKSQISAVNLMDPEDRPGCADHALFQDDQDAPAASEPELAPTCLLPAQKCEQPY